jgi:NodT family efflux transporter outer membrane factor (OMF) lipoprotein
LSACVVGPDYRSPELGLTATYRNAPAAALPASSQAWWNSFHDAGLSRVVNRALAQNLDIAQARARVLQSRAAVRAASAALLPGVAVQGSAQTGEQSLLTPIGALAARSPGFDRQSELYGLGGVAAWEIDLFGGLRRREEAATAEWRAAEASSGAVQISVAAEAADAYVQVRELQGRLAVAEDQVRIQHDLAQLLEQRLAQGEAAERELHEARAALDRAQAGVPTLTAELEGQYNRLDVLMGAQPGTYRAELAAPGPVPRPPPLAAGDGPAELLRRRPDVAAAEQRLIAANAGIGAAISEYYPHVSLAALLGVQSLSAGQLFTGAARQGQLGVGVLWPLFDFGRIDADVSRARGREAEALAGYRLAALHAVEDVENAFSNLDQSGRRAAALRRQADELGVARGQHLEAYQAGAASLNEVLDADRDLAVARDQALVSEAAATRAAVAAYRALGGGWTGDAAAAQLPAKPR